MRHPISYDRFRCGLSFEAVRAELAVEQRAARDSGLYLYVTRSTVLGRMRQYKLAAYDYYLQQLRNGNGHN